MGSVENRFSPALPQLSAAFDQMAEELQMRDHARQKAEQSHALLAALVESGDDAIVGRTLEGTVTSWNHGAKTLFGYTKDEMMGQPVMILVPGDEIENLEQNFDKIRRGERIDAHDTVRVRKDGKRIHVPITVSPILDDSGKVIGESSINRDISQRKQTEEEIRALHELNLAVTSTLDLDALLNILMDKREILFPHASSYIR